MSDTKTQDRSARISLGGRSGTLEGRSADGGVVRQSFSHGRSKAVAVEVKKQRRPGGKPAGAPAGRGPDEQARGAQAPSGQGRPASSRSDAGRGGPGRRPVVLKQLTDEEKQARVRALVDARKAEEEGRKRAIEEARIRAEEEARRKTEEEAAAKRKAEEDARRASDEEARRKAEEAAARLLAKEEEEVRKREEAEKAATTQAAVEPPAEARSTTVDDSGRTTPSARPARPAARPADDDSARGKARSKGAEDRTRGPAPKREDAFRGGKIVLDGDDVAERKGPSLAAMRRRIERERRQMAGSRGAQEPMVREVVLPETIVVSELANRMAVRGGEVVKRLMKMGVMATVNQAIDADTAELIVEEFGHKVKRVAESDVEIGLEGVDDRDDELLPRAPVVTIMGHVDHGKTSLLDALRNADVAAHEAGGITQHIGAYQVRLEDGRPVTFIDTPGHAAFSAMRARGAQVTDIVVLVVAANDGVMPQTIEAIRHAKAAEVPIIVAINKIDLPEADPERVKSELLGYEIVAESFGGDVQTVEVSATQKQGLAELLETINLQAEILELTANPNRPGQGTVVEAQLDRGRGVVATVLVQRGTLRVGDVVVCGDRWGKVRALIDYRGQQAKEAGPSEPVEVLGLDGVPEAGDQLVVVDSEKRAREITDYRLRKRRETAAVAGARGTLEEMFSQIAAGQAETLAVVVKADVHGSLEAIQAGFDKLGTDEVKVRVLHGGVGGITESDVTLALASKALIIGFNVRANAQARELAKRDGVEIRYYSIIYELLDEVKGVLSGMLSPVAKETILGHAEIREVFDITKVGKVAGCRVVDGLVRRAAHVRLIRDDVVIHTGMLGTLRRFKDDVREVKEGFECGMAIENYGDIRVGDVIEAYEVEEVARTL
ncbi:translation initiation factor IF-2 [Marinivivus vitaminiproducens]|uniref:translation initiation factor IF-2 n=1 Tax=Marinivivus vitaminiproducens TaxID=3035935 RepID=UPI0027989A96|nr:translation initiation factor IF-2 [Geminicoccaceae bacterium SCSIO 64248]